MCKTSYEFCVRGRREGITKQYGYRVLDFNSLALVLSQDIYPMPLSPSSLPRSLYSHGPLRGRGRGTRTRKKGKHGNPQGGRKKDSISPFKRQKREEIKGEALGNGVWRPQPDSSATQGEEAGPRPLTPPTTYGADCCRGPQKDRKGRRRKGKEEFRKPPSLLWLSCGSLNACMLRGRLTVSIYK